MKALPKTIDFVSANKFDLDVRKAAYPFLLLLSTINFENFMTDELQKHIVDLIR